MDASLRWAVLLAAALAVGPPQFIYPEKREPGGKSHEDDGIGRAGGCLHASAVVFVRHPLLHLLLCCFDLFLIHVGWMHWGTFLGKNDWK